MTRNSLSPTDFTGSVKRGFSTLLQVSAFLLFFAAVIGCLSALPGFGALPPFCRALIAGGLEMTSGISLAASTLPPETAFLLTAFLSGFAGLSVCLQLFSVTEGTDLRILPYVLAKTAHGVLNAVFAALYLALRRPEFTPAHGVFAAAGATGGAGWLPKLAPTLAVAVLVPALAALGGRKRRAAGK